LDVPGWLWLTVFIIILGMLALDLFAHREAHVISVREAAWWSALWVSIGVGFGGLIWFLYGEELGQEYFSGFIIEKSLAVDNVFIWAIIFAAFAVPREYQHRVLFLGVLGALIFRGIFIAAGYALISSFGFVLYFFAAFLIFTGIQMLLKRNEHPDPTEFKVVKIFQKYFRTADKFYGQRLLIRKSGILFATPLLLVLVLIEFTDIVFAVDSIPAIFAVTDEPFIVFTANAFAVLGLRAMYFLLADLIHRFVYLKIGLSVILVWVGIKMALHDLYKIPTPISLGVIILVTGVAVAASLIKTRGQKRHGVEVGNRTVYPEASNEDLLELEPLFRKGRSKS
jgi:tellurite resistance protein TerC